METDALSDSEAELVLDRISRIREKLNDENHQESRKNSNGRKVLGFAGNSEPSVHSDRVRYLQDENFKLQHELSDAHKKLKYLSEENRRIYNENREVAAARAEATLLRKQIDAIRSTYDGLLTDRGQADAAVRIEALETRLHDLQLENRDLKRQLAGFTPERGALSGNADDNCSSCEKCERLRQNKYRQARYFQSRIMEKNKLLDTYREEMEQLRITAANADAKLRALEVDCSKKVKTLQEHRNLYKTRSERMSSWHKTQISGFTVDMENFKSRLAECEKYIIQAQQGKDVSEEQQQLIDRLAKLTMEAVTMSNEVKRWKNVFDY